MLDEGNRFENDVIPRRLNATGREKPPRGYPFEIPKLIALHDVPEIFDGSTIITMYARASGRGATTTVSRNSYENLILNVREPRGQPIKVVRDERGTSTTSPGRACRLVYVVFDDGLYLRKGDARHRRRTARGIKTRV